MKLRHHALLLAVPALAACFSSSDGLRQRCVEGDSTTRACGNCGLQVSYCANGVWGAYSSCSGEGICSPGAQESSACGSDVGACQAGTSSRTCTAACTWEAWSACGGTYVGPTTEICGNGLDDDCNGIADEVCNSVAMTGDIVKLVASPDGGTVYALDAGTPSRVIVLDAATHAVVSAIVLPQQANDMDLSANGQHLVVAHDALHQVSKIDLVNRTVLFTKPVASDPYRIEVNDAGVIYYVELDQWVAFRRVNANVDFASDTRIGSSSVYEADIELSPDGNFLYAGEAGISGATLYKFDVSAGGLTLADQSTWGDGYGFPYPVRHLYLGADGKRAWYASHQLDAANLAFTLGDVGGAILAEDRAGTLAVGGTAVFDALTLRPVATLPRLATCATFARGDTELWFYDTVGHRIVWLDKAGLGDAALGVRDFGAEALSAYALSRMVRDPARAMLYGVDAARGLVVGIDATTLQPVGSILVGSTPTDLAISSSGDALYVGHLETLGMARIDLATFTFDRFVVVPRVPYELEPLSSGRIAIIDEDQWTTPAIVDSVTGAVLASLSWGAYEGALAATADGNTLFVAESSLSGSNMTRYTVATDAFTSVGKTTYDSGYGFPYPARRVAVVPDGSAVYYAGFLIDGSNLAWLKYAQPDAIVSITPGGTLATSSTKVYRVSDGALLGTLTTSGSVQAVSPDGTTLYVAAPGAIHTVDLTVY